MENDWRSNGGKYVEFNVNLLRVKFNYKENRRYNCI